MLYDTTPVKTSRPRFFRMFLGLERLYKVPMSFGIDQHAQSPEVLPDRPVPGRPWQPSRSQQRSPTIWRLLLFVVAGVGSAGVWFAYVTMYSWYSRIAPARGCGVLWGKQGHGHSSSHHHIPEINKIEITDCGRTVEEAIATGCKFDPMSFSWLPPACFDGDLIEHFLSVKDWRWYSEASNSSSVGFDIVQRGEHPWLWVTREFHLYHCTYQWRKMHRAILQGRPMDAYIGNYTHTGHCEHVLVKEGDPLGWDIVDVQIRRKFVTCGGDSQEDHFIHIGRTV